MNTAPVNAVPVPFGAPVPHADSFRVRMRDGIRLHTDLYPPHPTARRRGRGRVPAVLVRTPYDKTRPETLLPDIAARLSEAGFAVVTQDVRGKVRSEGEPVPFAAEAADAWDTLEWLTAQPWSDGTVGCWGNSYYGFTAWAALAAGHPAVRALVVRLTTTDVGGALVHHNGVFRFGPMVEWLTSTWAGRANLAAVPDWSRRPLTELLEGLPAGPGVLPPAEWATTRPDTAAGAARWRELAFGGRDPGHGRVPTLHWTGWYDLFQGGQLRDWRRAVRTARAPQQLIASATDHQDDVLTADGRSPDHLTDAAAREAMLDRSLDPVVDFLHRHVGRRPVGAEPSRVWWESTGAGRQAAPCWPPPGAETVRLHLVGDGTGAPETGGGLRERPAPAPREARWEHDPGDLVPVTDSDWWRPLLALPDERTVERRPDVLTFTGDAAPHALQLAGPARLVLPVASSVAGAHLVAKLCDVAPDGASRRVLEAPYRMDGEPGAWQRVRLELGDTGHLLRPGHRLRVQLSSSCFPLHLPQGTGRSTQRLRTGGRDGAHLELTVLPTGLPTVPPTGRPGAR